MYLAGFQLFERVSRRVLPVFASFFPPDKSVIVIASWLHRLLGSCECVFRGICFFLFFKKVGLPRVVVFFFNFTSLSSEISHLFSLLIWPLYLSPHLYLASSVSRDLFVLSHRKVSRCFYRGWSGWGMGR